jgi:ribosomal protein S18 acetylase RimI-like enzyme
VLATVVLQLVLIWEDDLCIIRPTRVWDHNNNGGGHRSFGFVTAFTATSGAVGDNHIAFISMDAARRNSRRRMESLSFSFLDDCDAVGRTTQKRRRLSHRRPNLPLPPLMCTSLPANTENDIPSTETLAGIDHAGSSSSNDLSSSSSSSSFYFIRPALVADIGRASEILTNGFFTLSWLNVGSYFYERLYTFLSLEATCKTIERFGGGTRDDVVVGSNLMTMTQQTPMKRKLFVACQQNTGVVLGLVEVDARSQREPSSLPNSSIKNDKNEILPYMCNLAIDDKFQRRGIATALVQHCEEQVIQWYQQDLKVQQLRQQQQQRDSVDDGGALGVTATTTNFRSQNDTNSLSFMIENSISLKVRTTNEAAIQLYERMGYQRIRQETDPNTNDKLLLMKKQLG